MTKTVRVSETALKRLEAMAGPDETPGSVIETLSHADCSVLARAAVLRGRSEEREAQP